MNFFRPSVIVGPLPNTIANGQLEDAVPVMANFNWIVNQVNANAQATGLVALLNAANSFTQVQSGIAATSAANFPIASQVQNQVFNTLSSTLGTNIITARVAALPISGYAVGQVFRFQPSQASLGSTTLNIDGVGAGDILVGGQPLGRGELGSSFAQVVVSGLSPTKFELTNPMSFAISGLCEGRLTLVSQSPVSLSSTAAATTIFWTPYMGDRVSTFNGKRWTTQQFTEKTVAVPATTTTPYDVFVVDGTLALETVNWSSDTARATALVMQDGVLVKSGDFTRKYLGTGRTTGVSGQTEDSPNNRFLWNYYNRVLKNTATNYTADRSTTSASYTELDTEIRGNFVLGVSESAVFASAGGSGDNASNGNPFSIGLAFDSATVVDPKFETVVYSNAVLALDAPVSISGMKFGLAVGFHFVTMLARSPNGVNTVTLRGTTGNGNTTVYIHTGIWG